MSPKPSFSGSEPKMTRDKQGCEDVWLAAHLYYCPPWEPFLVKAVAPFVEDVLRRDLAQNFFFIRYPERGLHIRLRLRGHSQQLEGLKPELEAHLGKFMSTHPSQRAGEDHPDLFPNNSVQYIAYEPEFERYGGPRGIAIAEELFAASSRACLAAFGHGEDWSYDQGLGSAITMHLTFAHAMGFRLEELQDFCGKISRVWMPRAYVDDAQTTQANHGTKAAETQAVFAEMFNQQKEALVSFSQVLWEALEEQSSFEQAWVNQWQEAVAATGQALRQALAADELTLSTRAREGWVAEGVPQWHQLWPILESYVHMSNNRLGILNRDEAYLGYLIRETIPYLTGEKLLADEQGTARVE